MSAILENMTTLTSNFDGAEKLSNKPLNDAPSFSSPYGPQVIVKQSQGPAEIFEPLDEYDGTFHLNSTIVVDRIQRVRRSGETKARQDERFSRFQERRFALVAKRESEGLSEGESNELAFCTAVVDRLSARSDERAQRISDLLSRAKKLLGDARAINEKKKN